MAEETNHRIKQIVAEQLSVTPEELTANTTFDSLSADSLDRVEIIMKIEEAFDIELDDDEAEKITTIEQLITYVGSLRVKEEK